MTKVIQTKVVVRNSKGEIMVSGNCWAAAIASLLELPITEVPNVEVFFPYDGHYWDMVMSKWLEFKGLEVCPANEYMLFHPDMEDHIVGITANVDLDKWKEDHRDDFYLCSGPSARGVNHVCIYQGGKMVHDPHPTGEGILNIDYFEKLRPIL